MPVKTAAKASKATTTKKATSAARKSVSKGDRLSCQICGMSVVIDEVADLAAYHELVCCGAPMKKKSTRAATTKKIAAARK